jgi:hypothetical protein
MKHKEVDAKEWRKKLGQHSVANGQPSRVCRCMPSLLSQISSADPSLCGHSTCTAPRATCTPHRASGRTHSHALPHAANKWSHALLCVAPQKGRVQTSPDCNYAPLFFSPARRTRWSVRTNGCPEPSTTNKKKVKRVLE